VPASLENQSGNSGLDDLMGGSSATPSVPAGGANNMDDLMGIFGSSGAQVQSPTDDLMNGFGGLNMGGPSQPTGHQMTEEERRKKNSDLLDLF
jgi:AP-1 complex subunit beta-1